MDQGRQTQKNFIDPCIDKLFYGGLGNTLKDKFSIGERGVEAPGCLNESCCGGKALIAAVKGVRAGKLDSAVRYDSAKFSCGKGRAVKNSFVVDDRPANACSVGQAEKGVIVSARSVGRLATPVP